MKVLTISKQEVSGNNVGIFTFWVNIQAVDYFSDKLNLTVSLLLVNSLIKLLENWDFTLKEFFTSECKQSFKLRFSNLAPELSTFTMNHANSNIYEEDGMRV